MDNLSPVDGSEGGRKDSGTLGKQGLPDEGSLLTTDALDVDSRVTSRSAIESAMASPLSDAVRPEMFGAVGNDTADDYTAIQAAIAHAGLTPVLFTGNYFVGTSLHPTIDGQTFLGQGGTLRSTAEVDTILVQKNRTTIDGLNFVEGRINIAVGNMTSTGAAPVAGLSGDDVTVRNCTASKPYSFVEIRHSHRFRVEHNSATGITNSGVLWWGGDADPTKPGYPGNGVYGIKGGWVEHNRFSGFVASGPGTAMSSPAWGACAEDIEVNSNVFESFVDVGIDFEGSLNCHAKGNTVKDCCNGNLSTFFRSVDCTFTDNTLIQTAAVSGATDLSRAAIMIYFQGPSSGTRFVNNRIVTDPALNAFAVQATGPIGDIGSSHIDITFDGLDITGGGIYAVAIDNLTLNNIRIRNGNIQLAGCDSAHASNLDVVGQSGANVAPFWSVSDSAIRRGAGLIVTDSDIRLAEASTAGASIALTNTAPGASAVGAAILNNSTDKGVFIAVPDPTTKQVGNTILSEVKGKR